jgi:hypothetical protein
MDANRIERKLIAGHDSPLPAEVQWYLFSTQGREVDVTLRP